MSGSDVSDWWSTAIIDMEPGRIHLRGHPIEELIGKLTLPETIWLMTRGEMPEGGQARLLESALVAAVDHGPQAPSIAAARMAVTCGLPLNNALATGVNMLGDVHGGAGEQAVEFLDGIAKAISTGTEPGPWPLRMRSTAGSMPATHLCRASATGSTSRQTRGRRASSRSWTKPPKAAS